MNHSTRCSLAAVAFLLLSIRDADGADALSPRRTSEVKRLAAETLAKDSLPGLSVAIAVEDTVWSAGFGKADLEQNIAVDAQSLFRTGSIVKWMTATAALRLVESGKLELDAPVQKYCPQYPEKQWAVTSRQLLTHLSGVRHYHGANGESRNTDAERKTLEAAIQRERSTQYTRFTDVIKPLDGFKDDPLLYEPGTHFNYSSLGYRLLGCVLEGAAGSLYRSLMRELIFEPAGMTSIVEDDAQQIIRHRVAGYARDEKNALIRAPFRDVSENLPAGGHLSTAEDLVRFATAFNSGKLVRSSTIALMIEHPKLLDGSNTPDAPGFFGQGPGFYYGMGIFVGRAANEEPLLLHTGSQPGAFTELLMLPRAKIAVAVMTNVSGWTGSHSLAERIAEIVARH